MTKSFLPANFKLTDWQSVQPFFDVLLQANILDLPALENWLAQCSELTCFLEENKAWRYIQMNLNTNDVDLRQKFEFFVQEISPKMIELTHKLNLKLAENPFFNDLNENVYGILKRNLQQEIAIFRSENTDLLTDLENQSQQYGAICSQQSIIFENQELTLQQAGKYLKNINREIRQTVYEKIIERRAADINSLNELFDELIAKRHQVALNAGFKNFRDYSFASMCRFDYTPDNCFAFHKSIEEHIVPLINNLAKKRQEKLQVSSLKPYDLLVDTSLQAPLSPFSEPSELIEKAIQCFEKIHPDFAQNIREMKKMGRLDLASKKGKAPGAFNYPLYETGYPFIYMNAVGSHADLTTFFHEAGHAFQSIANHRLPLVEFKNLPAEIAELASMSMELIGMETWSVFYNPVDCQRAYQNQLEDILQTLAWVAQVDAFQHWIYENPQHNHEQRNAQWLFLCNKFGVNIIDWKGYEYAKATQWQKQLHLFEVPFYYIEYGFAQLGAIAIWKNYLDNPKQTLQQYQTALALGNTKSIPEVYSTAGISFDFSANYVKELSDFIQNKIN